MEGGLQRDALVAAVDYSVNVECQHDYHEHKARPTSLRGQCDQNALLVSLPGQCPVPSLAQPLHWTRHRRMTAVVDMDRYWQDYSRLRLPI